MGRDRGDWAGAVVAPLERAKCSEPRLYLVGLWGALWLLDWIGSQLIALL